MKPEIVEDEVEKMTKLNSGSETYKIRAERELRTI